MRHYNGTKPKNEKLTEGQPKYPVKAIKPRVAKGKDKETIVAFKKALDKEVRPKLEALVEMIPEELSLPAEYRDILMSKTDPIGEVYKSIYRVLLEIGAENKEKK